MPTEMEDSGEKYNEGASSSSAFQKQDKKNSQPWIEKYRPQKFEEIMGR